MLIRSAEKHYFYAYTFIFKFEKKIMKKNTIYYNLQFIFSVLIIKIHFTF